jgi:hypothetical protein
MSAGHEDEFETYLRQRSVLPGRPSSLEGIEPPKDLDAIVLDKARRAIHAPPPMRLYRAPRWALPVALAATILLSFSVVLNISLTTRPSGQHALTDQTSRASGALMERQQPASAPAPAMPPALENSPPVSAGKKAPEAFVPAPEPAREAARAMQAPSARAHADAAISPKATPDPATWLRRIEALRAQGRTAEADAELRRFHQAFPDYPQSKVPPALRDPAK